MNATVTNTAGTEFQLKVITRTKGEHTWDYIAIMQGEFTAGDCEVVSGRTTCHTGMVWSDPIVREAADKLAATI